MSEHQYNIGLGIDLNQVKIGNFVAFMKDFDAWLVFKVAAVVAGGLNLEYSQRYGNGQQVPESISINNHDANIEGGYRVVFSGWLPDLASNGDASTLQHIRELYADEMVERWHAADDLPTTLREYLGFSQDGYAHFVTGKAPEPNSNNKVKP